MKLPYDQCIRRRFYLVRHGHALGTDAASASYGDTVNLTERGENEARSMRDALRPVGFDRVVCSGIQRAMQTAEIITEGRGLEIEKYPDFRELKAEMHKAFEGGLPADQLLREFSYCLFSYGEASAARIYDIHKYDEFFYRVTGAFESLLLADESSSTVMLTSHSMVNRALLCWALDLGPAAMANFEQDTGCANVLDLDLDLQEKRIVRKIVRMTNFTPGDSAKVSLRLLDSEESAPRVAELVAAHRAPN